MPSFGERLKNSWNAFLGRDPTKRMVDYGSVYGSINRPDRPYVRMTNLKSIVSSIYNQIAVDCSLINIYHVRLDEENRFKEIIDDSLNRVLTKDANIDQTGRAMIQDAVMSMLDEGVVAIVPTWTDVDPNRTDSYKILELRVGRILEWYPKHVRLELYNDTNGQREQIVLEKSIVAIVQNPFYEIMNQPNSLGKRLTRLLAQLDRTNETNSSGKLDLIIQLPYVIKSDLKRNQAEQRRKDIEAQLTGSQHGIAYTDATEHVIQLNRSVENNLWTQAKEVQEQLFNQLGLCTAIFNGTADEKTLLNYNNRTIEPILTAIVEEMERKWISKTAQTQKQGIRFFKDPFKLVPVQQLAEIVDKLTRNEVMSSNEFRSILGLKPSDDPRANELRNSNLNHPDEKQQVDGVVEETEVFQNEKEE